MTGIMFEPDSGDLMVTDGELAIGDTEAQNAVAVVLAWRGELKEFPLLGGEAESLRGGGVDVMWAGRVREMLRAVGVECERVTVDADGTVTIED